MRWIEHTGFEAPDAGFVEAEAYEKEFVEWCIIVPVFTDDGITVQPITNEVFKTITELYEYWITEYKRQMT